MIMLNPSKGYATCSSCGAENVVFDVSIYRFIQQRLVFSLCLGCLDKLSEDVASVQGGI